MEGSTFHINTVNKSSAVTQPVGLSARERMAATRFVSGRWQHCQLPASTSGGNFWGNFGYWIVNSGEFTLQ